MRSSRSAMRVAAIAFSLPSLAFVVFSLTTPLQAQNSEQVAVGPPIRRIEPPPASSSAKELETVGDLLQSDKNFLDAIEYYQAALAKDPHNAILLNKVGMSSLALRRIKEARRSFENAIRADKQYASAYANLGVAYYIDRNPNYTKAIRYYDKAIELDGTQAIFYNNRAAALFAKKQYEKASIDYAKTMELDPDFFERNVHGLGVEARVPSPQDRARYDYVLAKLYARSGSSDRSLHYLRKAMEDGYKDIKNVYRDQEFSELRKDPRFAELMASKPVAIQN